MTMAPTNRAPVILQWNLASISLFSQDLISSGIVGNRVFHRPARDFYFGSVNQFP